MKIYSYISSWIYLLSVFLFRMVQPDEVNPSWSDPSGFSFLVEGPNLQFETMVKTSEVTFVASIPFTLEELTEVLTNYDKIVTKLSELPAFNEANKNTDGSLMFLAFLTVPLKQLMECHKFKNQIFSFKSDIDIPEGSKCKYTFEPVVLQDLKNQYRATKLSTDKISLEWTFAQILTDPIKETQIQTALLTLKSSVTHLHHSLEQLLSTVDTLASNRFPDLARGQYHTASCVWA